MRVCRRREKSSRRQERLEKACLCPNKFQQKSSQFANFTALTPFAGMLFFIQYHLLYTHFSLQLTLNFHKSLRFYIKKIVSIFNNMHALPACSVNFLTATRFILSKYYFVFLHLSKYFTRHLIFFLHFQSFFLIYCVFRIILRILYAFQNIFPKTGDFRKNCAVFACYVCSAQFFETIPSSRWVSSAPAASIFPSCI